MIARGIRNKNPGNLRHGDKWQGMSSVQNDSEFITFDSMVYGLRALIKTLMTYHNKHGLNTVREIISRWAPSTENNTEAYVSSVAKALGVNADDSLTFDDATYIALAKAIARHENGSDADLIGSALYDEAVKLA